MDSVGRRFSLGFSSVTRLGNNVIVRKTPSFHIHVRKNH